MPSMPRIPLLQPLSLAGLALFLAGAAEAQEQPNILLIVLDDVGIDQIGAWGFGENPPPTPRIDALATSGVRFEQVWSNPNCSPTRASLLTGRHAFRHGIGAVIGNAPNEPGLAPEELILPELLDLGGDYVHAAFGKWHLASPGAPPTAPNDAGFGHYDGSLANLDDDLSGAWDYSNWPRVVDGVESVSNDYLTSATVDAALDWIGATEQPWFAYVAFHAVHSPFHWPPAALHSVDPSALPSGKPVYWQHRAMMESLDTEIGRLVDGLGPAAESTTIIVVGDNGTAGPGVELPLVPGKSKHTLYGGGIEVPLLIAGAGVTATGVCQSPVQVLDLFATVAELAGVDPLAGPNAIDSIALTPYLADPAAPPIRPYAFSERRGMNQVGAAVPGPADFVAADPNAAPLCQLDAGFGGPGPAPPSLTLCGSGGQGPVVGNQLELILTGAPVSASSLLIIGLGSQPTPFLGGNVVPSPIIALFGFVTDGAGQFTLPVPGAIFAEFSAPAMVSQTISIDPTAEFGNVLSNAVEVPIVPFDRKAVVDLAGWKYIITAYGGSHELYNLSVDPLETVNLLAGGEAGLTPTELGVVEGLRQVMLDTLASPGF